MWRAPAVFIGLVVIAWLEFAYFPGHTYLLSSSQLYVAALEHLIAPGYLLRDFVAIHPDFALTVYDELTLLLHSTGHLSICHALLLEQFLSRAAALFGIYLLNRTAGLRSSRALVLVALINLGTFLPGPNIWLFEPEPVPRGLALGPALLGLGFIAQGKPLVAGLAGGYALLLDPVLAAPFWLVLAFAFAFDRKMRVLLRPAAPVLLVFALLLANLAQLQQGIPESQPFFSRISQTLASIEQFRTPELWVTLWPAKFIYLYLALLISGIWAVTRIWPAINRQLRWILLVLPLIGFLTVPASALLLDHYRWSAILRFAPMELLVYTVVPVWLAWGIAAARAFERNLPREAAAWFALTISLFLFAIGHSYRKSAEPDTSKLARWAETKTWGSSMFAFPDAGRASYPGRFRAQSRRALWVDWQGGKQVNYETALAPEWQRRWNSVMRGPLSTARLQDTLSLPVDYLVFDRKRVIKAVTNDETRIVPAVFMDDHFAVYEASTLRLLPGKLILDQP